MPEVGGDDGKFLVLEGGEGAGKSTCAAFLAREIEKLGHQVIMTREPGGCELAEGIRELLMRDWAMPMPAMSELLLMFAARAAHIEQKIKPALERGLWVVSDRFTDASYVYQGMARQLGEEPVALLEQLVQADFRPDQVLLLDIPVEMGLARVAGRGEENRFDRESVAFHERVRGAYLERAKNDPQRYTVIDASQSLDAVEQSIADTIATIGQVKDG